MHKKPTDIKLFICVVPFQYGEVQKENIYNVYMRNPFYSDTKAHLFIFASFAENSTTLAESISIGTPSVVSPVGGVMSLVKDEESALFLPSGDYKMLAYQINKILKDNKLDERLSEGAKTVA